MWVLPINGIFAVKFLFDMIALSNQFDINYRWFLRSFADDAVTNQLKLKMNFDSWFQCLIPFDKFRLGSLLNNGRKRV